jgi:heavy metal sensor kinase
VYDAVTGSLITRSEAMQALGFEYAPDEVKELVQGPDFTVLGTDQVDLLLFNDRIQTADGKSYLVQVAAPLTHRNTALRQLLKIMLWLFPAGIVLAVVSGSWMAGRVLRPLEALGAAARGMTISDLHRRLPLKGNRDELDRLAETFNDMFGRLERAVGQMKDFTASISHELRTPLTALRGEAEVALARARSEADYRRVLESQLEEFGKLSGMIDRMLTLARAEAGQIQLARDAVNLSDLARSLVEQMEVVADNKSVSVTAELAGEVFVNGDQGWLERAILNLLDNAIKFTPPGGRVVVAVSVRDGEAMLEVRDNGIGIEREALPRIFERFFRADPARSKETEGAGLGLSLVEWIVREHQGNIRVRSRPGEGSSFEIALPLTPAAR